jgi:ketosteroid isomerase-like protein
MYALPRRTTISLWVIRFNDYLQVAGTKRCLTARPAAFLCRIRHINDAKLQPLCVTGQRVETGAGGLLMKQRTFSLVTMVIATILVSLPAHAKPQDEPNIESEIRAAETNRFRALTEGDLPTLERSLSDDLVYTHASGWRQTKREFLASLRSGELVYHSFTSDGLKIRVFGSSVVVTGDAVVKVRAKGQELNVSLLYLEVYAEQDGRWQLAAWQSTRQGP